MVRSFVALALVASSVTAYAQIRPAPAAPAAPVGLRLTPVTVATELRTRFASKRRFDASKLPVTYRGDTPVLRVKNGRSYQLASNAEQVQAATVTPPAVAEIDKRKAAIQAWRPGVGWPA